MPHIIALPTNTVRAYQSGQADAYGQTPKRTLSDGGGNPCRHCLRFIPKGAEMLILAHRPFPAPQPYAETGPIFLCAEACTRHDSDMVPEIFTRSPDYLIKGYSEDDRIVYGTGVVIPKEQMMAQAEKIFADPHVRYIHVRSARNNCYQARIER